MPRLNGILETSLYTDDMDRARAFYEGVLGLQPMFSDDRLTGYAIEKSVLLLFRKGTTEQPVKLKNGSIPGHRGTGELHVAFPIAKDELETGQSASAHTVWRSKARMTGRAEGAAFISAIPTAISWSLPRLGCGRCTSTHGPLLRISDGGHYVAR